MTYHMIHLICNDLPHDSPQLQLSTTWSTSSAMIYHMNHISSSMSYHIIHLICNDLPHEPHLILNELPNDPPHLQWSKKWSIHDLLSSTVPHEPHLILKKLPHDPPHLQSRRLQYVWLQEVRTFIYYRCCTACSFIALQYKHTFVRYVNTSKILNALNTTVILFAIFKHIYNFSQFKIYRIPPIPNHKVFQDLQNDFQCFVFYQT